MRVNIKSTQGEKNCGPPDTCNLSTADCLATQTLRTGNTNSQLEVAVSNHKILRSDTSVKVSSLIELEKRTPKCQSLPMNRFEVSTSPQLEIQLDFPSSFPTLG